jgi:ParB-like chromosome segregation protein Spo0J
MTGHDLRKVELQYRSAQSRADLLRLERNRAVREALDAGWTHAQIAEATGLTRGRVGQLAKL